MDSRIENFLAQAEEKNPGVADDALADLALATGLSFPEDYLDVMRVSNGAVGFVGDGGYLRLFRIEDLVQYNVDYRVEEWAPGLFLFGTDGGGEAFAFDTRQPEMPIVIVPFIGMSLDDALPCGSSFKDFFERLADPDGDDLWG